MKTTLIPKEIREKTKNCFECGICTASCPMAELLQPHYNPRTLLQKTLTEPEKTLNEDQLWLCAWCYKCYERCPQSLKPPEIFQRLKNETVKHGSLEGFERAVSKIAEIPLPVICLYTCFHPERAKIDIERVADALQKSTIREKQAKRKAETDQKEKIAIVGSGPAGLTAACELAKAGHSVTIFEALPKPGGMLRKCMPEYRLPKKALDREIQLLEDLGVDVRVNQKIGKSITFEQLRRNGYTAVFVAAGAHKSRRLGIEGEDAEGVVNALEFLWKVNMQKGVSLGKKVGVIGGGNVAMDAARTAVRHGAHEVNVLYRRSREEMPASPWEVNETEEDGVNIQFLIAPRKVIVEDGKVAGFECVKMKLGEPDESGRKTPVPVEGSEFSVALDTLIVAIGEEPEISFLPGEVELDRGNRIAVDPITMETSMEGVFAGGDVVTGPATVIEAVLAGVRAASSIHNYLTNRKTAKGAK